MLRFRAGESLNGAGGDQRAHINFTAQDDLNRAHQLLGGTVLHPIT